MNYLANDYREPREMDIPVYLERVTAASVEESLQFFGREDMKEFWRPFKKVERDHHGFFKDEMSDAKKAFLNIKQLPPEGQGD